MSERSSAEASSFHAPKIGENCSRERTLVDKGERTDSSRRLRHTVMIEKRVSTASGGELLSEETKMMRRKKGGKKKEKKNTEK